MSMRVSTGLAIAWSLAALLAAAGAYFVHDSGRGMGQAGLVGALPLLAALLATARLLGAQSGAPPGESPPAPGAEEGWPGGVLGLLRRGRAARGPAEPPVQEIDQSFEPPVAARTGSAAAQPTGEEERLRALRDEIEELSRTVKRDLQATQQARESGGEAPGTPAEPHLPDFDVEALSLGLPTASAGRREPQPPQEQIEEMKGNLARELSAARSARETAERMRGQAERTLEQASAIQSEAMRFRSEDQEALRKAAAAFAQAQEARHRAAAELQAARQEAERVLQEAQKQINTQVESLRSQMREEKVKLLSEAAHQKAEADQQLENARRIVEDTISVRKTVQGQLDQVLEMRKDVERLRREAFALLEQVARGGAVSDAGEAPPQEAGPPSGDRGAQPRAGDSEPPAAGSPQGGASRGVPEIDDQAPAGATDSRFRPSGNVDLDRDLEDFARTLRNLQMGSGSPPPPPETEAQQPWEPAGTPETAHHPEDVGGEAGEVQEEAGAATAGAGDSPGQDLGKALEGLGLDSAEGQGAAEEPPTAPPAPAEPRAAPHQPAPQSRQAPQPGKPGAGESLEDELAAILGRVAPSEGPPAAGDRPQAAGGPASAPAPQGEPAPHPAPGGVPSGGPFSGQFQVTVKPLVGSSALGQFWTALEKAVGLGNILASTPLGDGSGVQFTVDVGRQKVSLKHLGSYIPGAEFSVGGANHVLITLPPDW